MDRFSASSDLDEKLVTMPPWPGAGAGMGKVFTTCPFGLSCSRKAGEVTPKLPSVSTLLNTPG